MIASCSGQLRRAAAQALDLRQKPVRPRVDDQATAHAGRLKERPMFKHILIPTDGSELSDTAINAGVDCAREVRARVTGFTAVPEYRTPSEVELMSRHGMSLDQYEREARLQAEAALQKIADRARAAGVEYGAEYAQSDFPHEAIVRTALKCGCDLIFMASHGRRGLAGLLLGSETTKVLTHSRIPVLVHR
jgi:nucleotide-binding universal stress UspA family protein